MEDLMATPRHSDDVLREAVELRSRYATAQEAADALGLPVSTLKSRLAAAQGRGIGFEPITVTSHVTEKPRFRVPYRKAETISVAPVTQSDEAIRVTVIGDLHVAPGQDLSRLKWIARHIGETQPDRIVQIGDWASFDSVSTHDPIGSVKAKYRPSLRNDIEALQESLLVFERELGPSVTPRLVTLGNHEDRVRRYQDIRAELEDSVWLDVLQEFARFRWQTHEFGKVIFIGGVGFTHVPLADNWGIHDVIIRNGRIDDFARVSMRTLEVRYA
jgi:hypothetical protein